MRAADRLNRGAKPAAPALVAALALAATGVGACGATPYSGTPVGMSDGVPVAHVTHVRTSPPRQVWPDFELARAWPEVAPAAPALAHRQNGALLHVRAEPASLDPYRRLSAERPMPDGARIAAWLEAPSGALLGGLVLEKHGSEWTALELDATGALLARDSPLCTRCHDMAPTDHLFGPRGAQPAPVTLESTPPSER